MPECPKYSPKTPLIQYILLHTDKFNLKASTFLSLYLSAHVLTFHFYNELNAIVYLPCHTCCITMWCMNNVMQARTNIGTNNFSLFCVPFARFVFIFVCKTTCKRQILSKDMGHNGPLTRFRHSHKINKLYSCFVVSTLSSIHAVQINVRQSLFVGFSFMKFHYFSFVVWNARNILQCYVI